MLSGAARAAALRATRPGLSLPRRSAAVAAIRVWPAPSSWVRGMADNGSKWNQHGRRESSFQSREAPASQKPASSPAEASRSPETANSPSTESSDTTSSSRPAPDSSTQSASDARKPQSTDDASTGTSSSSSADAKGATSENDASDKPASPLGSLPDLTQGIPSTLAYETAGATNRQALTKVEDEVSRVGGGRSKGELPASAYISSTERKRQRFAVWMFGIAIGMTVGGVIYMGRNWNEADMEAHPDVPNGWGIGKWWNRSMTRMREWTTYYQEPAFPKLLPDLDPSFARPYTLVISMEDMLLHSEWTREHGWRLAKRPGVDYFLRYLSQYYELVLFTTVPFQFAEPIIRKMDPYRIIMWPLFREATKYEDGENIKDLSYLNRDLSKVIVLDTKASHVKYHLDNAIILPQWTGDPKDTELVALIPFLEYIHTMQYPDVRKVLKSFEGKHIPTEFARREAIARKEFEKQLALKGKGKKKVASGMGVLGSALGLKPSSVGILMQPEGEQNTSEAFAEGKMLQDIARERGQRNYEFLEKQIRENGEQWLKEEQALQEKMNKEAMNSMMGSFTGWFTPAKREEKPDEKPDEKPSEKPSEKPDGTKKQ